MGFGIVIFPSSWRLGVWSRVKKSMVAIGPIRLVWHKRPGDWKPARLPIIDCAGGYGAGFDD